MTFHQAIEFIHGLRRFGSKPGLKRVTMLLERMGNPQDQLRFIHVAGTNGKGSTCAMLSHIYTRAGYRTGLYISPYVLEFRERIQLNNEMISREDLAESTARVKAHWDALEAIGEPPTEFEVVVAVAMDYFLRMRCDVVVLEVGLGGRFDATNAIKAPLVSVITGIGLDHTQYLGETIADIALEKCGIIKKGGVTVTSSGQEAEALAVIMERCAEEQNPLFCGNPAEVLRSDITGSDIRYGELELHIPLAGLHQVQNAVTAVETVWRAAARLPVPVEAVVQGMAETRFPARLEALSQNPLVLLDGAHNEMGARVLAQALAMLSGRRIHAVMGMLEDKDIDGVLAHLAPLFHSFCATQPDMPRSLAAQELAARAQAFATLQGRIFAEPEPAKAFASALSRCEGDDVLVICGSLYLASEMRPIAQKLSS